MAQEARARATHPNGKTSVLFEAVLKRGHKAARGNAAPRAYVYGKRIVWPKNTKGLGERQAGADAAARRKRARRPSSWDVRPDDGARDAVSGAADSVNASVGAVAGTADPVVVSVGP